MNEALKIWLVDDDEITSFVCREILKLHLPAAQVTSLGGGEMAFEQLVQQVELHDTLPDIILLDINMPLMNGWEFLEKVQSIDHRELSKLNIFMLTSSVYFEDTARAANSALVKNIITKPLNIDGINKILDTVKIYDSL